MKSLKIALIFHGISPDITAGSESAISLIAKYLSQAGHQVNVIVTQRKQGLPYKENRDGYCLWRIRRLNIPKLRLFSQFLGIGKILYKIQPDIIFGLGISPGGIASALFGKLFGTPSVTMVQGRDLFHGSKALSRFALMFSNKVIALTSDAKSKICHIINRQDTQVISYGIEMKRFLSQHSEISQSHQIILYVGRLSKEKGTAYLIHSMVKIKQQISDAKLIICGDGPERGMLINLVGQLDLGDRIQFVGAVSAEDVVRHMKSATLIVVPSIEEDLGIVNLEAMASGLPIIASNVGGIPDIVKDGVNGFLVNPRDVQGIADKVISLLRDKKLRVRISQNNLVRAKDYDWVNLIKQYENICFEALKLPINT